MLVAARTSSQDPQAIASLRTEQQSLDGRINEIEQHLRSEFPAEAEMVFPRGASVDEARGLIRGDEALVMFETFDDATYYWVVTRDEA
jgi:hypothetical protein